MPQKTDAIVISDDDATASSEASCKSPATRPGKKSLSPKRNIKATTVELDDWSDESEDFYETFRKRKASKNKLASSAKRKGKTVAKGRPRKYTKRDRSNAERADDTASDSEPDLEGFEALPQYIRNRRSSFDQNYKALKIGGLRLPPDFSDVDFSDDERLGELEEKPNFDKTGIKPCQPYKDIVLGTSGGIVPASIAQYLREYQIKGVEFLHHKFVYQKGAILGDDMGLGKTVQVAAFLTAAFGKTGDCRDAKRLRKYRRTKDDWYPRALIICPGGLIQNWRNELQRWGWWVVDLYHGAGREDVLSAARAGRLEVMITTYATYRTSCNQINTVPWDVVVADECHSIKGMAAETTQTMNRINSLCRIGLTGTAIQNRYEELWALLNWTNPGQFGTMRDWKQQICKPLTLGQSHDATMTQLSDARKTAKKLKYHLLPRFFLRRTKSLISHELPKKRDRVVFCSLSDLQREAYENMLSSPLVNFVLGSFEECPCGSKKKAGWCHNKVDTAGASWQSWVFPIIVALQKLSNHFNLIVPQQENDPVKSARNLKLLQAAMPDSWEEHFTNRNSMLNLANPEYCGKWKVLRKLLKFWHDNGDKVLVFSRSVRLLMILKQLCSNTSYNISYLDGSLPYEERQEVVDDFNSDPNSFVFLISTQAGGVGLNITSANKVVIMDPHWNPAHDLQAQDRAYRIGQVRDVDVYRFISTGTIEEITYARQIYKQQQANIGYNASNERRYFKGVQQESGKKGEIFGIHSLMTYHGDQGLLRDIVNKTNIAEARAGVKLIDIDVDHADKDAEDIPVKKEPGLEDDDSGGLRHLSNILTKDDNKDGLLYSKSAPKPKSDPIQAILASEGVEYSHENSEVIGSSKIEDELSRQAELADDPEGPGPLALARALFQASQDPFFEAYHTEYNPPEDVRRRQFCTMAKTFGFPSATDFALAVESMTQAQRRNCLDLFYKKRVESLKQGEEDTESEDEVQVKTDPEIEEKEVKMEEDPDAEIMRAAPAEVKKEEADTAMPAVKQEDVVGILGGEKVPVKEEDGKATKPARRSLTIWLSDDEETDEL